MATSPAKKVVVLGSGRVGGYIAERINALGLSNNITVVDAKEKNKNLPDPISHFQMEVNPDDQREHGFTVKSVIENADLVVNALPGHLGFKALQRIIECGKNCVDISFMPEDPTILNDLAVEKGVTVVVDMGIAPGLCGVFIGHEMNNTFSSVESAVITVGGLPYDPAAGYHATFSPADIIEEYTRPARIRRHNQIMSLPALSETKRFTKLYHPDIPCKFESFLTDGLRTLLNLPIPNMEERTLRYAGYANQMRTLKAMGCFDEQHMPLTLELLQSIWKPISPLREITIMHIIMHGLGIKNKEPLESTFKLMDVSCDDFATSMARTTGMPAVVVAKNILDNELKMTGILTPEQIGANGCFVEYMYEMLRNERIGININRTFLINDWDLNE